MGMKVVTNTMRSMGSIISTKLALVSAVVLALAACATTPPLPKGHFIKPVDGFDISSGFGPRGGRPHKGADFRAPPGTPIVASIEGQVRFVGWQRGFGRLVIIDHGRGVETYYAHMQDQAATVGQQVAQGEVIGFVGMSGNATGPHVHFEVRVDGEPIDPMLVLARP